jgi:hypothetical protein
MRSITNVATGPAAALGQAGGGGIAPSDTTGAAHASAEADGDAAGGAVEEPEGDGSVTLGARSSSPPEHAGTTHATEASTTRKRERTFEGYLLMATI